MAPILLSVLAPGLLYVAVANLFHAANDVFSSVAPSPAAAAARASADFLKVAASSAFDVKVAVAGITTAGVAAGAAQAAAGASARASAGTPRASCGVAAAPFAGVVAGVSIAASRPATVAAPAFPAQPTASGGPS